MDAEGGEKRGEKRIGGEQEVEAEKERRRERGGERR
jgi:hypothetical protein